jgi:drug/metabolite transporter (DMT)-like permease
MPGTPHPSAAKVWAVLGALYFVWGTTYLGISLVNETIPTFLGAAARFLFAGTVLFAWASVRTGEKTTPRQWRGAAVVGVALLLGGNAFVAASASLGTPTGIISLIIALIPLWLALFDRVLLRSAPLGWRVVVGLVGGFCGAALLIVVTLGGGRAPLGGLLMAVAATLCWTAGSLYARSAPLPEAPLLGSGMQQVVGGGVILAVAIALQEPAGFDLSEVSARSWGGLAWLIVAGSFVGFSAYLWLLRNVRTSLVSTYAYVNPIVAITLGVVLLDERFTVWMLLAALIILASVALIVSAGGTARRDAGAGDGSAVEQGRPEVQAEI